MSEMQGDIPLLLRQVGRFSSVLRSQAAGSSPSSVAVASKLWTAVVRLPAQQRKYLARRGEFRQTSIIPEKSALATRRMRVAGHGFTMKTMVPNTTAA